MLKTTPELDELESDLNDTIESYRKIDSVDINYSLISKLQQDLYEKLLEIKGLFNIKAPLRQTPSLLDDVQNEFNQFLDQFKSQNFSYANDNFVELLSKLSETAEKWKKEQATKPVLTVQISELPLTATNLFPQVFHTVNLEGAENTTGP